MPAATLPPTAQSATASELVRHFGDWQRRAAQAPVYVLNHGRPQLVLCSVEFMQTLAAQTRASQPDEVARILDALSDPVLITDPTGQVVMAGRAARLCFGDNARPGARLDAFLAADVAQFLADLIARVAATRISERAELSTTAAPRIELTIEPYAVGALITGRARVFAVSRSPTDDGSRENPGDQI